VPIPPVARREQERIGTSLDASREDARNFDPGVRGKTGDDRIATDFQERPMKKIVWLATSLLLCLSGVVSAGAVAGVTLPPTVSVEGKTLKLNGTGLRKKMVFKVYAAGLYVETPSKDPAALVSADEVKQMRLSILRGLKGKQVGEAISEGFEKNSKAQIPALRARLDRLNGMIPDVTEGDELTLTYVPGKGTVVAVKGAEKGVIEGKDFADALFAVWLGANPVQEDLKQALLGS